LLSGDFTVTVRQALSKLLNRYCGHWSSARFGPFGCFRLLLRLSFCRCFLFSFLFPFGCGCIIRGFRRFCFSPLDVFLRTTISVGLHLTGLV
jgi:hypothetical protein